MVPNVIRGGVPNAASLAGRTAIHRLTLAVLASAVVGCGADQPTAAVGPPAALQRVSGDGQTARPGDALERPLVARLVDSEGHPVRRADVRWSATAGEVSPAVSTTNANGEARATWRLGTTPGPQRATARAEGLDPVEFVAFVEASELPDRIALRAISLSTYDGSDQVVHPDAVLPPFAGLDDRARLVITPYPWGNANFENPSMFEGNGRDAWHVAAGATNPVVRPGGGYLSDPDILWLEDRREFWLYYRQVTDENRILVVRSPDGVHWGAPQVVVHAPNHTAVSPTVVRRSANDWLMWTVDSGAIGCGSSRTSVELRRSSDGITWSAPSTVALSQAGVFPWHLDVQWIPALREYWALFNGKVAGSCTTDALYLATSNDGVTWRTFRSPVLSRGAIPEFADIVYRATFAYEPDRDAVSLWHSGARFTSRGYEWRAAYERRRRTDLLDDVARATTPAADITPSTAPPLTNATAP